MLTDNIIIFYIVVGLVGFLVGLSKGGLGGTLGALATPLLALVLPPEESAIGLVLPILMIADPFAVGFHWKRWDRKLLYLLLPGAVIGVTVGTYLILNAPSSTLRVILGVIVLLFVVYKLFEKRIEKAFTYQAKDGHGVLAGVITGFSSSLAHIGGPPASIYLLMVKVTPQIFVGTSAIFFFLLNWVKVPYYIYARQFDIPRMLQILPLMPLVPLGVWLGKVLVDRINRELFEKIIVGLLALIAVMLLALR
jgi:hypothetical protein